jgi:hypothetical protein
MLKIFKILLVIILLGLSFLLGTKYPQFGKIIDGNGTNNQTNEQVDVVPDFIIEDETTIIERSIDGQIEDVENVESIENIDNVENTETVGGDGAVDNSNLVIDPSLDPEGAIENVPEPAVEVTTEPTTNNP